MAFNNTSGTGFLLNTFLYLSNHTPESNIFANLNKAAAANNPGNFLKAFSALKRVLKMKLND